jgi:hypothetical protein
MTKRLRTFQLATMLPAVLAAQLTLAASAFAQARNLPPVPDGPSTGDILGGSIYSPDGITHIVGDGMGGGFVFGPAGMSSFIGNGMGGGTVLAPNSTGAIISDGMGGGVLYAPKSTNSRGSGTRGAEPVAQTPPPAPILLASLAILGVCFIGMLSAGFVRRSGRPSPPPA